MTNKIIVITGVSGSGKSTIGKIIFHRFKNVVVIDTDDIDDASFEELFESDEKFRDMLKDENGEPHILHEKVNKIKRDKIIKEHKNTNIVFVGMTIDFSDIEHIGYFLETPVELNYRRVNDRTLKDIMNVSGELEELYHDEDYNYIDALTCFRYKIRQRFPVPYEQVVNNHNTLRQSAVEKKYKIMTGQEILTDLETIIEPIFEKTKIKINNHDLIIHVSGVQGSGKSHMGDKLKLYYGDIIHVKDLDELQSEFSSKDLTNYQGFIDQYILDHKDKPIIFVGLDADICLGGSEDKTEPASYNLHADHKMFIDLDDDIVLRQRFYRQIQKLSERKEMFFDVWLKEHKEGRSSNHIQKKLIRYINLDSWNDNNKECREHYKKRGYQMLKYTEIFNKIESLLVEFNNKIHAE